MIKLEITTCEQYVLAELEDAKNEVERLQKLVDELEEGSNNLYMFLCILCPDWMEQLFGNNGRRKPS